MQRRFFALLTMLLLVSAGAVGGEAVVEPMDTIRVLCIGNSFTYVDSAHIKLRDIAFSEGHYIHLNAQLQGGYTFQRHMRRDETLSAIIYYTYDYAFLQDQSRTPALYALNPHRARIVANDAKELAQRIRVYSPGITIFMEQTWSYAADDYGQFGSFEYFDDLLRRGSHRMARRMSASVSPIGEAFRVARDQYPEINLYSDDLKHQSAYGSYLKACVNYLLLYRKQFTDDAANCSLDPAACACLRKVAEQVVLH